MSTVRCKLGVIALPHPRPADQDLDTAQLTSATHRHAAAIGAVSHCAPFDWPHHRFGNVRLVTLLVPAVDAGAAGAADAGGVSDDATAAADAAGGAVRWCSPLVQFSGAVRWFSPLAQSAGPVRFTASLASHRASTVKISRHASHLYLLRARRLIMGAEFAVFVGGARPASPIRASATADNCGAAPGAGGRS